jgi:hypothetical protein
MKYWGASLKPSGKFNFTVHWPVLTDNQNKLFNFCYDTFTTVLEVIMAPLGFPPVDVKYKPNDHRMQEWEDVIKKNDDWI